MKLVYNLRPIHQDPVCVVPKTRHNVRWIGYRGYCNESSYKTAETSSAVEFH